MKLWCLLFFANFSALSCCVSLDDQVAVFKKNTLNKRIESVQWLPPLHSKIIITIGVDEYYSYAHDFDAKKATYYRTEQSRTKCAMLGTSFKPRKFFEKSQDEQIKFLQDAILECGLLNIIDKRRKLPNINGSFSKCGAFPYPSTLEAQFEHLVWQALHKEYDITLPDFKASLRKALRSEDALYSAPLIAYYAPKLAPRYECHYTPRVSKVIKRPSEFEILTGTPDTGKVVYEATK